MNAVVELKQPELPASVVRRNINDAEWRTLMNNLYPGASGESVLMVVDYCRARKLDPLKKPCHIVPMSVKDAKTGKYEWRDVVMPGIYEYRTTATRTGFYLGHSKPEYGPATEYKGVTAPEWCEMVMYRWNEASRSKAEYPVRVLFAEIAATTKDGDINKRWSTAPTQMLTKCTEAAGLREAFPDEFGGTHTVEEMDGRIIEGDFPMPQRDVWCKRFLDALDVDLSDEAKATAIKQLNIECNSEGEELYNDVWRRLNSKDRSAIKAYIEIASRPAIESDHNVKMD